MIIIDVAGRPYPMAQFSTDDFGNEVMAVAQYNERIARNQIIISWDTFMHLFDMEQSIHCEAALCAA